MSTCCLCNSGRLESLITVDGQPIGNRFLQSADADEYTHSKHLAVCRDCGLVQLVSPISAETLMPVYDWITYNEPEPHLDRVAEILLGLEGIDEHSVVGGVSFKDDTTLARLEKLGVGSTWRIDPVEHLAVERPGVGVETVQDRLPRCLDAGLKQFREGADILCSRHILEHCHDLQGYIRGLKAFIRPGGYLFLEVPCCDEQFERLDYAPLWEEHIQYYTPPIFKAIFEAFGFELVHYERVPYPMEDSLVGIGRLVGEDKPFALPEDVLAGEIEAAVRYGALFGERKEEWHRILSEYTDKGGKVAIFGAGHLGCTFTNVFELSPYIQFVVDDNPDKLGLYMPGSRLPIKPSAAMAEEGITLALFCLNPSVEDKVVANNQAFIESGGRFASIFPKSARGLDPAKGAI